MELGHTFLREKRMEGIKVNGKKENKMDQANSSAKTN